MIAIIVFTTYQFLRLHSFFETFLKGSTNRNSRIQGRLPSSAIHSITTVNIGEVLSLNCTWVLDSRVIPGAPPRQLCLLPKEL